MREENIMDLSLNKRWAPVLLALAGLLVVAGIACGSDDSADDTAPAAPAAPAAPKAAEKAGAAAAAKEAAPAAKAEAAKAGGKSEAAAAAKPAATVAKAASAKATTAPTASGGPEGELVRAFTTVESVYGIGYVGPYRGSATNQIGGIEEALFNFEDGLW